MAKKKLKRTKKRSEPKDPRIEETYEKTVWFDCPQRGRVSQKVKVKRYKSLIEQTNQKHILDSKDPLDRIENGDDGLSIYNDGEDLGISGEKDE